MSRTLHGGMAADVASGATTLARCALIELRDGSVLAITDHNLPLTIDLGDGAHTYTKDTGMSAGAIAMHLGLGSDVVQLKGPISEAVTRAQILGRRFARARFRLFDVNWADVTAWAPLLAGKIAEAGLEASAFTLEGRSWADAFNQTIGRVMTPYCPFDLGVYRASGARRGGCPMQTRPPAWSDALDATERKEWTALDGTVVKPSVFNGFFYEATTAGATGGVEPAWPTTAGDTVADGGVVWTARPALTWPAEVTAVIDDMTFEVSFPAGAPADDVFNQGLVEFETGELAGTLPVEVFDFVAASGRVTLYQPLAEEPTVGDTLSMEVGCDKLRSTCRDTFRTTWDFGGDPEVPGSDNYYKMATPGGSV